MDSNISVSVVIPVYNAEKTIISCIESVLSQSYSVSEIIIINDGSTDSTKDILENYLFSKRLNNVYLYNQINSGPSKARNYGIMLAKSEWIAFLDSDDRWLDVKLEKQLLVLENNVNCKLIGTLKYNELKIQSSSPIFKVISFKSLIFKNYFLTSSVVVSKDILKQYMFDEHKKYAEDYKLWLQIIYSNQGIIIEEGLFYYSSFDKTQKSLSHNLFKMEIGVYENFKYLYTNNMINFLQFLEISLFSFIKFIIRSIRFYYFSMKTLIRL